MKFLKLVLILSFTLAANGALADCFAADPNDSFWRSVCAQKSEALCKWEKNCRWSNFSAGVCTARDENDGYWRSVCASKNETLCKWEENCVWNE